VEPAVIARADMALEMTRTELANVAEHAFEDSAGAHGV
jgi:hypothetical protein